MLPLTALAAAAAAVAVALALAASVGASRTRSDSQWPLQSGPASEKVEYETRRRPPSVSSRASGRGANAGGGRALAASAVGGPRLPGVRDAVEGVRGV
eukprot:4644137-Prymnesium_polylepis.1